MFCKRCGKELDEGAKFCGKCGAPVESENKPEKILRVCPKCGFRTIKDEFYCENCGTLLNMDQTPTEDGSLLREYRAYTLYTGRPKMGIAKATGKLRLYSDRVEFEKVLGNAAANMGGLIGMTIATKSARKEPILKYFYRDVAETDMGKYAGIYNTVVLVMRDGREVSFCPPLPNSNQPMEILNLIKLYIQ